MNYLFNPHRVLGNLRYLNKHTQPNPISGSNYIQNNLKNPTYNMQNNQIPYNSNKHPLSQLDSSIEYLFDKIRQKLIPRGLTGVLSLGKYLRGGDSDNSRKINFFDFSNFCLKFGFGLNDSEIKSLFGAIDINRICFINYDEFLQRLRGCLNPYRKSVVEKAFSTIDRNNNNFVDYF